MPFFADVAIDDLELSSIWDDCFLDEASGNSASLTFGPESVLSADQPSLDPCSLLSEPCGDDPLTGVALSLFPEYFLDLSPNEIEFF